MTTLPLAIRYALRELRGGLKGFRILAACLALGVAAIAASGSLRAAVDRALAEQSQALLGGDLDLRQSHLPFTPEERKALAGLGRVTMGVELRAMALGPGNQSRALVEMKGVDGAYPLVGKLELTGLSPRAERGVSVWPDGTGSEKPRQTEIPPSDGRRDDRSPFSRHDGVWGAAAEANLLTRLGLSVGDRLRVGEVEFQIRAVIAKEPDRVATGLSLGPRLMVSSDALAATGLIQPGSLIRYTARLLLAPGADVDVVKAGLATAFPDAAWQMRDGSEAAPGLDRFLDSLSSFLTLVGLTALLVGGVGVANAVKAYLDGKIATIATLKCLGAPAGLILATYLTLVGLLSAGGIVLGLAVGAVMVPLVALGAGEALPLPLAVGIYPAPLALAAGFGALSALVFTLWPLARARAIPAAALFRRSVTPLAGRPRAAALGVLALGAGALGALTVLGADNRLLGAGFVGASLGAMALFRLLAWGLSAAAARLSPRLGRRGGPALRLALASLHRPGSAVVGLVLSLGLGLSVLVTIALVEGNLADQFGERMPQTAPSFFFIDIQPDQLAPFREIVASVDPAASVETAAMVRGRISHIRGLPVEQAVIAPEVQWAARGDRGLSSAVLPPPGTRLAEGQWWPADYKGSPLVSVDQAVAKGFGLKLGDHLGLNVLGREIEVEVASLRQIEWSRLSMNFAFLLSPGALEGAPYTAIATLHTRPELEAAVEKAVTDRLPNLSSIRVKEALEAVRAVISQADLAVRLAGLVTLAAGTLVLAGAVLAGHRRRVWETVVLKVLGASRRLLWRAHMTEFLVVGLATGLAALGVGAASSWAVLVKVMKLDWVFLPGPALGTVAVAVGAALLAGFAGAWWALRAKAAPLLRED